MEASPAASLAKYRLTDHARQEMARRDISEAEVAKALSEPEQVLMIRPGRVVYQSQLKRGEPLQTYLLRIFVDTEHDLPAVVTAYTTSKVSKYWRTEP